MNETMGRRWIVIGALAALASLPACDKLRGASGKGEASAAPSGAAPKPVVPAAAVPPLDVPFKGTFTRTAKVSYRNGQRIVVANMKGSATLQIEPGTITFKQTYPGTDVKEAHVTQIYSFAQSDVKQVTGGYDVDLKFVKMDADTKAYFPDDRNPHIQARRLADGWQIGLLLADANGTHGGSEFR